jgi:hypothetical protein
MSAHSGLAAAATLVSLAFALCTLERWVDRRRRHEAAWTVALLLFAAASAAMWAGATVGWGGAGFRLFYLFGAVLDVPVLALGTVELLAGPRAGQRATMGVVLFSGFAAGVLAVAPLHGHILSGELPRGSEVFGAWPRVLAAVGSGVAALVVLAGAVWSILRLLRTQAPGAGRLAGGNALIALGTLVLGAGGLLNSVLDEMDGFAVSLVAGIALIFAGFLVASASPRQRAAPVAAIETAASDLASAPCGSTSAVASDSSSTSREPAS